MKDQVRPIYSELQGYLSQAPATERTEEWSFDIALAHQLNNTIDELNVLTGKDYGKFKVETKETDWNGMMRRYFELQVYRTKLGGLISRLYGEYFSNEIAPFSGMPNTVIQQNQTVTQQVQIQMLLEIQSKVDEKLHQADLGEKEKSFLQKIKDALPQVRNTVELIRMVITIAKECGLPWDKMIGLFT